MNILLKSVCIVRNSRFDVVIQDFSVKTIGEEATIVRSKGQSKHGRFVSSLHLDWGDDGIASPSSFSFSANGPHTDDFVVSNRSQKSPVNRKLDCNTTKFTKVRAVEGRRDIRFSAVNSEALGIEGAMRISTIAWWCASIFSCFFCRALDRFPCDTSPSDRLFNRSL